MRDRECLPRDSTFSLVVASMVLENAGSQKSLARLGIKSENRWEVSRQLLSGGGEERGEWRGGGLPFSHLYSDTEEAHE